MARLLLEMAHQAVQPASKIDLVGAKHHSTNYVGDPANYGALVPAQLQPVTRKLDREANDRVVRPHHPAPPLHFDTLAEDVNELPCQDPEEDVQIGRVRPQCRRQRLEVERIAGGWRQF